MNSFFSFHEKCNILLNFGKNTMYFGHIYSPHFSPELLQISLPFSA